MLSRACLMAFQLRNGIRDLIDHPENDQAKPLKT
jgi:hypothetical protein